MKKSKHTVETKHSPSTLQNKRKRVKESPKNSFSAKKKQLEAKNDLNHIIFRERISGLDILGNELFGYMY
ncbi:MAG: hypothetical protein J0M08_03070 [Bacteroidetes bacterium]|nr:hypothetical protein [Bacteroidota bacterium]